MTTRETQTGKRWVVRCRVGGRYGKLKHLGSFRTKREATACLEWARMELAQGRVPDRRKRLEEQVQTGRPLADVAREWLAGRRRLAESSRERYADRLRVDQRLDVYRKPASRVTVRDVQAFIAALEAAGRSRSTIDLSLTILRLVLDYAEANPNPARDRRIELPHEDRDEIHPPNCGEVVAILAATSPKRYALILAVLEATALRISDALNLRWGDVDFAGERLRVQASRGKSKRSRFVPCPPELLECLARLTPLEDRDPAARVWRNATRHTANKAMSRACQHAGIASYSPKDLRHRCLSRWVQTGKPLNLVAEWAGHSDVTTLARNYVHVLTDTEEAWRDAHAAGIFDSSITRSTSARRA